MNCDIPGLASAQSDHDNAQPPDDGPQCDYCACDIPDGGHRRETTSDGNNALLCDECCDWHDEHDGDGDVSVAW